jgi:hypothetical protein
MLAQSGALTCIRNLRLTVQIRHRRPEFDRLLKNA